MHSVGFSLSRKLPSASLASFATRFSGKQQYGNLPSREATAIDVGTRLEVQHPRWPHSLRLSYPWLRDHCRCPQCYNHLTSQRKFDITQMPLNIRPAAIAPTSEGLELKWPDGHKSTYEYKFLWQNTYEGRHTSYRVPQLLWTAHTFPKPNLTTVPLEELMHPERAGVRKLVAAILRHGFAFISKVPADVESTRLAVEQVCSIKRSFFGEMWGMKGTEEYEHYDTAYSSEFIGAHTDNTYFSQACRIQVFHCVEPAVEGGENLLVDGFSVAQQFREKHPEGYAFLSSMAIPSEYLEEGQHHNSLDTIFKHNAETGCIRQFRYNIYDRAPLSSIPMEKIEEFYLHFSNLTKIIRNPRNEHLVKLDPGTVLLIDNWRTMHGRQSFSGGKRVMIGCYLDNDDFTSSARVLGLQVN